MTTFISMHNFEIKHTSSNLILPYSSIAGTYTAVLYANPTY